ncbi:interleukin-1 receptor type 1-like isoform X2 [Antechinus flavipes]|uniref:interleukin-1 receptor type 1-like isoform X2 n=1 Tax=Antechinus flavipes TaxID=38775 RepID=UPI0022355CCA|nr:interleukin-1 receptor type 1-like isoform X2 [Antechinus flavipes]XP_051840293.1 interleukin-1 receptor type 1-like isoform X2 [Antechinus flavipes]XP_051840294.1 interleukin-1 receptor type 1-like isoform X2 [Antechinus flavipes]XP_051840295.1 interleukin-1 receptor type 1-like isoform X2 [Antechinus flavipes]
MTLFWYACFIVLLSSSFEAEDDCVEFEENIILVTFEDELAVRHSNSRVFGPYSNISWYGSDGKTVISMDQNSRVHQYREKLWFVPAATEDSGYYYRVERNSTHCRKQKFKIEILKKHPGTCYDELSEYKQKLLPGPGGFLVCPNLDIFKDDSNLSKIQWYKDCKPLLGNTKFKVLKNHLYLGNVEKEDEGHYTCLLSYDYMGQHYNITRAIHLNIIGRGKKNIPKILSPENRTIEVELGSQLLLDCNFTAQKNDIQYWTWNGSYANNEPNVTWSELLVPNLNNLNTVTRVSRLVILKVESRHYLYPFLCWVSNDAGIVTTYIALKPRVLDARMYLIGGFISLALIVTFSVFLYKFFKVEIVLLYRDSCHPFILKKASDGKVYDAYILYPKNFGEGSTYISDIFVFKILPEVLENQCGYNLFIYGRDDLVGEDAIMAINENIMKSRRLIIVLAGEQSSYNWLGNTSEQQIAMYNALVQDGIKIILVELEKIKSYGDMPESIKYLRQKHGVIRWKGNFMEESPSAKTKFWRCLRYHMPAQRHWSSSTREPLVLDSALNSKKK